MEILFVQIVITTRKDIAGHKDRRANDIHTSTVKA